MQASDVTRSEAVSRIEARRGFQNNVIMWAVFSIFFVVIWAVTGQGFFWPIFPIIGWAIGLLFGAWKIYGKGSIRKPISEKDIQQEMSRLGKNTS